MDKDHDALRRILEQYLNANSVEFELLKSDIERNREKEWTREFKRGLRHAIDERVFSIDDYERLTDSCFDTEEELWQWLEQTWNFLYEGGVMPE